MKHRYKSFVSHVFTRLKIFRTGTSQSSPLVNSQETKKSNFLVSRKPGFRLAVGIGTIISVGLSAQAVLHAQVVAPAIVIPSLKTVPVPGPSALDLAVYIQDKAAAIQLGKALFWDVKVGSDNKIACATCHFQAGADNRITNQLNPGVLGGSRIFQLGQPNYTLKPTDFPLTKYATPDAGSLKISDVNTIVSSQGAFTESFTKVSLTGGADGCVSVSDAVGMGGDGFHRNGFNTRRVEPRNTPTVINAVFNFRNFWDGRANNVFNGGDPFGLRNPNLLIWKIENGVLQQVPVSIPSSSLASQGSGPPLSENEMSCNSRAFIALGQKLLNTKPLATQQIDPNDSVLGPMAAQRALNQQQLYKELVQAAFQPSLWSSPNPIGVTIADQAKPQSMDLFKRARRDQPVAQVNQMEANFSLFFSLALQMYQATLVSDNAPFDQYAEGDTTKLTVQQQNGMAIFKGQGQCIACHGGAEFTHASFSNVIDQRLERMLMGNNSIAIYDNGFYNIGVRPTTDDIGIGGLDPFGNPLSETRMVQNGKASLLGNGFNPAANPAVSPTQRVAVDGAFKVPSLRNVELTGPYFHNGGKATLMQVVDFYNRGGDFADRNIDNLSPNIQPLGLTQPQKNDLVSFLLSLTDERVRYQKAPFDHPSICIPNGHVESAGAMLIPNISNLAKAAELPLKCIPAIGANGAVAPLVTFMNLTPYTR